MKQLCGNVLLALLVVAPCLVAAGCWGTLKATKATKQAVEATADAVAETAGVLKENVGELVPPIIVPRDCPDPLAEDQSFANRLTAVVGALVILLGAGAYLWTRSLRTALGPVLIGGMTLSLPVLFGNYPSVVLWGAAGLVLLGLLSLTGWLWLAWRRDFAALGQVAAAIEATPGGRDIKKAIKKAGKAEDVRAALKPIKDKWKKARAETETALMPPVNPDA